jgi:hypothetical protein
MKMKIRVKKKTSVKKNLRNLLFCKQKKNPAGGIYFAGKNGISDICKQLL